MGLFDLFKGGKKGETARPKNAAAKWAERAGDKRAQNYDRQEAIQALADMGTADAAAALLKRFTFVIDPSITDQEEKDVAFKGVVEAGRDAIEPVRTFAAKAESLAWPMKILKELLSDEEQVDELLVWLARWDTEYAKFVDPKVQILAALEEFRHQKIREAVRPFLDDVNEPARFHAVSTTLAQDDSAAVADLVRLALEEESVRIRSRIAEGIFTRGWTIPEESRDGLRKVLPSGYTIDGNGKLLKRG